MIKLNMVCLSKCRRKLYLQVPHEALEIAGMSINFRSGKFGYSICNILSRGHAEIFRYFLARLLRKI